MKLDSVLEVHQLLESFFDILNSAEFHFNYFHQQSEVHAVQLPLRDHMFVCDWIIPNLSKFQQNGQSNTNLHEVHACLFEKTREQKCILSQTSTVQIDWGKQCLKSIQEIYFDLFSDILWFESKCLAGGNQKVAQKARIQNRIPTKKSCSLEGFVCSTIVGFVRRTWFQNGILFIIFTQVRH